jgi:hypothetical protein
VRTGANSFLDLQSTATPHRIFMPQNSEAFIDRWIAGPGPAGRDEIQIDVRRGMVLVDLPAMTGASTFELKGSNFIAGIRGTLPPGPTVAAIGDDGSVLVRSGRIAYVAISPSLSPSAFILNAGQMFDPMAKNPKPIPASSNQLWNLLLSPAPQP